MSVDKSMLSREVPRFTSPEPSRSKKDLLISSPDKTENLRVFTPQRRHHFSPIRKTMQTPKITRIVEGHLMPFRDTSGSRKKRTGFIENEVLLKKEFGEDINTKNFRMTMIRPKSSWSKREVDWFNAERRFVFACYNEKERKYWIQNIKALIEENS